MLTNYWKFQNRSVQTFGFVYHDTNGMVQYGRHSRSSWKEFVRASFSKTIVGKAISENPTEIRLGGGGGGGEKVSNWGMLVRNHWKRVILICVCGWHQICWKETKQWSDVESTQRSRFGRTNIFPGSCILGLHSKKMRNKQRYCGQLQNHVRIANFCGGVVKIFVFLHGLMTWLVMQRSVWNDIVSWRTRRLSNSTKYLFHALMTTTNKEEETKSVGELSNTCSQKVLKCLYMIRIGRPDILWSVNKLARSIIKWTKACDKRLNRLISYIHHTSEYKQYCHVGNTAKQCR